MLRVHVSSSRGHRLGDRSCCNTKVRQLMNAGVRAVQCVSASATALHICKQMLDHSSAFRALEILATRGAKELVGWNDLTGAPCARTSHWQIGWCLARSLSE